MDNSSLLLQRRLLWRASSIWPEAEPRPRGGEACFRERESEHFSSPSLSLLFFKGAKANVSSIIVAQTSSRTSPSFLATKTSSPSSFSPRDGQRRCVSVVIRSERDINGVFQVGRDE